MKNFTFLLLVIFTNICFSQTYPIVDTKTTAFYSDNDIISEPSNGDAFFGQDANYQGNQPSYTNNNNGTITDNVTGLIWQQDMGSKISYADALIKADTMSLAGYNDWRVPTIKELYSLILFNGQVQGETAISFFIDTNYFIQPLGDTDLGEREIDAQTWSLTQYKGLTMNGDTTVFGVNFIDGRIKGYPKYDPKNKSISKTMYFRMVRGNTEYGINNFIDNQDLTISDNATGLMWQKADNGIFYNWEEALNYAESLEFAGYDDWRLPNAKELQSIVDYDRCPQTTNSPAINSIFECTEINDPDANPGQYPYYWTSTSHLDGVTPYAHGVYIAFGEAQGKMNNNLMDVHGAGAQRSDPKSGDANNYPEFYGPQGDVRYVYNAVRCVRDINESTNINNSYNNINIKANIYPNPSYETINIYLNSISDYKIEISNLAGQNIYRNEFSKTNKISINSEKFRDGILFVRITSNSNSIIRKIIKD